ncbi:DNA/RNA non-specific endonuclease [Mucilaginibacter sabulilitoris]|uniref:DNA/RNA non-specific endonuclease n=1 Tax=Mucilaginibacter sabulilitoris TaxID=1173583 RepID=A0ABZ0TFN2_9SPHI|nr:DNA/RNA non-specific endonuclease [Mucilaginibacter sabulilitoris]WPU91621.1 DNA/RNA non-specific endonuclease [Mucilaginibacter sabulilitoris]
MSGLDTAGGAILSDTYTFNAGMEFQRQNICTEIATEELCRKLTGYEGPEITDSVKIWCDTYGTQRTYTKDDLTITVPSHYYKIIKYLDHTTNQVVTLCYWMPNQPTERRAMLPQRMVDHAVLVNNLGFDPQVVFKE